MKKTKTTIKKTISIKSNGKKTKIKSKSVIDKKGNISTRLKNNLRLLKKDPMQKRITKEMSKGFDTLNKIDNKLISVFGSHVTKGNEPDYIHCKKLCYKLGKEGYGTVTGGGPGIMQAANVGAKMAKAPSLGFKAGKIKNERVKNNVHSHVVSFDFMFARRFFLAIKSEALIFYPGGYGTLNELFEYVTLVETGLVDPVPLICVDKKYWEGLFKWLYKSPYKNGMFGHDLWDLSLLKLVDKIDDIVDIVKNGEVSTVPKGKF